MGRDMAPGGGRNKGGKGGKGGARGQREYSDVPEPVVPEEESSEEEEKEEGSSRAGEEPGGGDAAGGSESDESDSDGEDGEEGEDGPGALHEQVERVKRRAREEMDAAEWSTHGYAALDLDAVLGKAEGNCARVHIQDLSPASFSELYEDKPCIIEGMLDGWGARDWAPEALADRFGGAKFKCGDTEAGHKVTISLRAYHAYTLAQEDDAPLYVFDEDFADEHRKTRALLDDFSPPEVFQEDLFQYLGEGARPPFRWILLGPRRSGSSIHIDPCSTAAWNTVISGRKRWVLFPPGTPRHILKPASWLSARRSEAIDWFLHFAKDIPPQLPAHQQPMEVDCGPGDTIYVPPNWWHTVLNLDDTVAVTQNFVSTWNFPLVWQELSTSRAKMSRQWLRTLQRVRPDLAEMAVAARPTRATLSRSQEAKRLKKGLQDLDVSRRLLTQRHRFGMWRDSLEEEPAKPCQEGGPVS